MFDFNKTPFFFCFSIFIFSFFSLFLPLFADVDSRTTPPLPPPTPPPPSVHFGSWDTSLSPPQLPVSNISPQPPIQTSTSPFKPSIAVIVGILTTMFSITFLLLLYAKHCKNGGNSVDSHNGPNTSATAPPRKSGIDRTVIESLPIFRFASLRGQKDGLECAVCLTKFEPTEVLRLLPKCKHAFHVECVDTWLDAHSTCPLCRYRVDPEDILLINDPNNTANRILYENQLTPPTPRLSWQQAQPPPTTLPLPQQSEIEEVPHFQDLESGRGGGKTVTIIEPEPITTTTTTKSTTPVSRQVSSRHSSAGERTSSGLFLASQTSVRGLAASRMSVDSCATTRKKVTEPVSTRCFDRSHTRKDGLLLPADRARLEHRIIISENEGPGNRNPMRWSDVQSSDLLYLRSELLINDTRRFSVSTSRSRPSGSKRQHGGDGGSSNINGGGDSGRSAINTRSMSEITGLNRFSSRACSK